MSKQEFLSNWENLSASFNELDAQINSWKNGTEDAMPDDLANTLEAFAKDLQNTVDFDEEDSE